MDHQRPFTRLAQLSTGDETVADMLKRRERELVQQTAALRGLLVPKERELEDVRRAMQALGISPDYVGALQDFLAAEPATTSPSNDSPSTHQVPDTLLINGKIHSGSIKDLILQALRDFFRDGATPSELSQFFKTAYNRTVDRGSISPQLARLRGQGAVEQRTGAGIESKWFLTRAGKLYDHPTSWRSARDTIAGGAGLDETEPPPAGSYEIPNDNGLHHGQGDPPEPRKVRTRLRDM
jgi:hypothetical protein